MRKIEAIRRVLRQSPVPLDATLIAELVGADKAEVEALLARLEAEGVVHHQVEWTLA